MRPTHLVPALFTVVTLALAPGAGAQSPSVDTEPLRIINQALMEPGIYQSVSHGTPIRFRIGEDGWRGGGDIPEFGFSITHEVTFQEDGIISVVPFDGRVRTAPCDPATAGGEASAASFIDWISQAPGVRVVAPASVVTLGGLPATQLDLEAVPVADCPDASVAWVVPFFDGYFYLAPETRVRLIAVDVGDQTLVVSVEAPAAKYESFIGHAEAVIASMTIDQDAEPSEAAGSPGPSSAAAGS